jgi:hypothetical protein
MSIDNRRERMMALGFGLGRIGNFPMPDGSIDGYDRAYVWGSFAQASSPETAKPYFFFFSHRYK